MSPWHFDSEWLEVKRINSFATFLGWLMMATRGLGFLAVTWITVILLGGFVSMLTKKDFWCLTVITVVQIVWALHVFLDGKLFSMANVVVMGVFEMLIKVSTPNRLAGTRGSSNHQGDQVIIKGLHLRRNIFQVIRRVEAIIKVPLGWITLLFSLLGYTIVVISLNSVLYGLFITTGAALWRLTQRDYGTADGDPSKANMTPALDVLYILVVVQGAILVYGSGIWYVGKTIEAEVAEEYGFKGPAVNLVRHYMRTIWMGCFKDPSFAAGKNLVTHAVDLMGPDKSPRERDDGLRILSTLLGPFSHKQSDKLEGQQRLIEDLILYGPSSTYILQNLFLLVSNLRSHLHPPTNGSEIGKDVTECATRVVAHVASMTSLEHLPQVIQCASSLISTFGGFRSHTDQHSDSRKEEKDYMEMLLQGLHILFKLAADQNKCRVIGETRGLLPKIMAPLTFDLLHQHEDSHVAWRKVVKESLGIICRLTAAPGETGAKLGHKISINREAISTMTRILNCDKCDEELQSLAMGILTKLDMDTKSREYFIEILVHIFTDDNRGSSSRRSAVDALAKLCFQDGSNAIVILQVNGDVVDRLTTALVASTRDKIYLISAAAILEHLCIHYTKDDECLKKLKEAMIDVMPKVLSQILSIEATQTGGLFSSSSGDIEGQHHGASQDNGHKKSFSVLLKKRKKKKKSSSTWQESEKLRNYRETDAAVLSLCVVVCDTFISGYQDLALQFDAIDANSLPLKLREIVTRNSDPTVSCLKIVKLTTRMVISMMRHRGTYLKKDLESLVEVLDHACRKNMFILDSSMVFSSGDDDDRAITTKKPEMSLVSLIQEARELVLGSKAEELEVMAPTTSASGNPD